MRRAAVVCNKGANQKARNVTHASQVGGGGERHYIFTTTKLIGQSMPKSVQSYARTSSPPKSSLQMPI